MTIYLFTHTLISTYWEFFYSPHAMSANPHRHLLSDRKPVHQDPNPIIVGGKKIDENQHCNQSSEEREHTRHILLMTWRRDSWNSRTVHRLGITLRPIAIWHRRFEKFHQTKTVGCLWGAELSLEVESNFHLHSSHQWCDSTPGLALKDSEFLRRFRRTLRFKNSTCGAKSARQAVQ